jgi:hypothetical protein
MTDAAPDPEPVTVRRVATPDLTAEDIAHAMGGFHWLAEAGGRIVAHVAVVPRELAADGVVRTEKEDDGIMILRTPRTPPLAGTEALSCEWRTGDAW